MLSLHPKGWRSSAAKLRPPVGHEIAEDARGPRDVGLPVDRTDDVATAILGAVQLRHQDIIPPEAALPEVVRPGRPPIPIDEDAAVGIRQVQGLLRSDLHARLGRTGGHKTGELEGRTTPQIRETYPDWSIWEGPVPGGESAAQVSERLDRVVARCREAAGPVLLFGHGHSLRALAARWLDLAVAEGRHLKLDTSTLSVLGWERETPVVLRWNA